MDLLPKSHQEFSQKEYWDSFFKRRRGKAFEWYGEYPELSNHLHKYIKQQDDVLIAGCGNSSLSRDLYDIGYNKITNIDISQVVIKQMLAQNCKERSHLKYLQMDVSEMSFQDESFSVVLDKGTLDALMSDNSTETINKVRKYFREIQRVLKLTGRYICVSLLQEHMLKLLLDYFPSNNWMFRVVRCLEAENKAIEKGENSMPVFLVVCTKFKTLPVKILEVDLGISNKMLRFESAAEVIVQVANVQQAAFVCSGLRRSCIEHDEIALDLFKAGELQPRFTVYVVDSKRNSKNMKYAAFIVPQGREIEWLFGTTKGRQHLTKEAKTNRLAVVTMCRGQIFGSFQEVQTELDDSVRGLAPANLKNYKIPYLSLGSDIGQRRVQFEGSSEVSGAYVIEDVKIENEFFRRLFYVNSQLVIQSEAKLKTIKGKKGPREVVDLTQLTCKHHIYMCVATRWACKQMKANTVLVVGLGGGGLCSFLHKFIPQTTIMAVDIDPEMLRVATEWFGLCLNDRLKVKIQDGVEYLEEMATKSEHFDAILFDVDSKDSSIGMSCPPKQLIEDAVLDNLIKIVGRSGCFILNLVIRDESMRPAILDRLRNKFKTVVSYKIAVDLNEILICRQDKLADEFVKKHLVECAQEINNFFKKCNCKDYLDTDEYLNNMHII